jgi:hypothetical protein
MTTPDRNAVQRQPKPVSASATACVKSPPTGIPVELMLSARARRRRNQATIATAMGR